MESRAEARPIWLDTDIIFNRVGADVDDGLALMLALDSPRLRLCGVSLNRDVANGERVTRRLLQQYARYPVPVYRGENDLRRSFGAYTPAVAALARALRQQRLTIVAIGAATNLATLLNEHPDLGGRIDEIVFCAGRREGQSFYAPGGRRVALPDANYDNDPASMELVLNAGIPITLAGFEAAASITLDAEDIARLRRNGRQGDRWVAHRLSLWRWLWRLGLGLNHFIPFDACTLGHVLYPECFRYLRGVPLRTVCRVNDAPRWKKAAEKAYLEVTAAADARWRVDYAYAIYPRYKDLLMQHLLGSAV